MFKPIPHLLSSQDSSTLSPLAHLVEALDLCGRAHTLQSQVIDPGDSRAVDRRRDASVTLSSAARRWFGELPFINGRQDGMTLMIVSNGILTVYLYAYTTPASYSSCVGQIEYIWDWLMY